MKFGNENELNIALTELRWVKKIRGKLRNSDFKTVSEKYKFPIDFLKKGIRGFSYPEDFLISKSKWFPILYSWVVRDRQYSINLFKLQFDYFRAKFRTTLFLAIFAGISLNVGSILQNLFKLDLLQMIQLAISFILSFIALYVALRNSLHNRKTKLEEYSANLEEMGLRRIIIHNEQFIQQHYRHVIHAGDIILRKMQSSPTLTLFYMRTTEKEIEKRPARFTRLLRKLHLLPKPSVPIEKEKIPVFYAENPHIEYRKRIEELTSSNGDTDEWLED
jgi:hypothetical protein